MAPDALTQVLRPLQGLFPRERFPDLLVGLAPGDDAAAYRISDDLALIATLDFFTPIVDDPYEYGAIAAANALSDVYAMGGRPVLALNICCLSRCLPLETIGQILRGGADKLAEAGAVLAGGHSVDDNEPKYGMMVLGFAHPDRLFTKAGACAGDVLVLTKPLGVGIITTAFKGDQAAPEHIRAATANMLKLNRAASEMFQAAGIRSCTDITGFALMGHTIEMAEHSDVCLRIHANQVPLVSGAAEYAEQWLFPAGTARNRQAYEGLVHVGAGVTEELAELLYTPETSGPLLAAVPAERLGGLQASFAESGEPLWVIGEVVPAQGDVRIELVAS